MVIFKSFLPFFSVVQMLQDCNDFYIYYVFQKYLWKYFPFLWFIFQFCCGSTNIKHCIWPETKPPCLKPFWCWMKQKAPSMTPPLYFCLSPFAWPVLQSCCFGKFESHSLEILSTKFFFFKKPPWGSFKRFSWDLWFLHCLQKK